uniref:Uncharacterized protein n=1 Tax=Candidatus Kentrum sp. UNK TaxID=2126344 RepID=A0A451AQQ0_9GAMM|nr:MAG: hypothetical protein BECKUNK1418G_GA0071005_100264 [Candidatus Kentron sp. UNK]VFK68335.1 MAG: hypothetical protein BECKUNK1418H_GA0071006_100164 [Candidatus Kentron sp. UNK]
MEENPKNAQWLFGEEERLAREKKFREENTMSNKEFSKIREGWVGGNYSWESVAREFGYESPEEARKKYHLKLDERMVRPGY